MAVHLLIVGRRKRPVGNDADIEAVAAQVHCSNRDFVMKRGNTPAEVVTVARDVARKRGMIDTLDLYDHAACDHLTMGDGRLFDIQGTGAPIFRKLRPFLSKDARVRLLGCETAVAAQGQQMLKMIRQEIGGSVVVYGTLANVTPDLFKGGIFRRAREERWLFSSTEADARVAPSWRERQIEIDDWHRSIKSP